MKITLKDMVFYGYHGTQKEEQTLGQRFIVSVTLHTDDSKDKDIKHLNDTVDYTQVYSTVKQIMENEKFELLENCANTICDTLIKKFTLIKEVEISIKKPSVPIQGFLSYSEIEMEREREE